MTIITTANITDAIRAILAAQPDRPTDEIADEILSQAPFGAPVADFYGPAVRAYIPIVRATIRNSALASITNPRATPYTYRYSGGSSPAMNWNPKIGRATEFLNSTFRTSRGTICIKDATIQDFRDVIAANNNQIDGLKAHNTHWQKAIDRLKAEKVPTLGDLPKKVLDDYIESLV